MNSIVKFLITIANDRKRYYAHRLAELDKVKAFISSPYNAKQAGLDNNTLYLQDNRLQEISQEVYPKLSFFQIAEFNNSNVLASNLPLKYLSRTF